MQGQRSGTTGRKLTERQLARIAEAASGLFASAVAQGMHAPFSLNVEYWGRDYADRLVAALQDDDPAERGADVTEAPERFT